ncbi:MAG: glycosyltransferase family 39 protein [Chitinivibrionales bacterium]|nr:glycosyltransferase family 39 protein [Chitinivibrionales bacterium]
MQTISLKTKLLFAALIAVVYAAGLCVPVMNVDSAQYAAMSRAVYASRDFFKALFEPPGYLDKPPLIFFLGALSFKLLGVSTISFKLPSLLISALACFSTYRLGKLLYNARIGLLAALILSSCEGFLYFTNDVRTDASLVGMIIFALWQFMEFYTTKKARFFLGAFLGIGLAMLAKGPIGCMVPALALGSFFLGKRDYKMFFKWYWPAGAALVLLVLAPMLLGLYREFGAYGIRFFFWTQSFGRITGESSWSGNSDYFFFVHSFLWAFLPWMLLAYFSLGSHLAAVIKQRFHPRCANDMLLLGGSIFPFVALSFSRYKLPHYIFVIFPLVAILSAKTIYEIVEAPGRKKTYSFFVRTQAVICFFGWLFGLLCMTFFFPCANPILWTSVLILAGLTVFWAMPKQNAFVRLFVPSLVTILGVNVILNLWFFPNLLTFQAGSAVASILRENHVTADKLFCFPSQDWALEFYAQHPTPSLDSNQLVRKLNAEEAWIFTDSAGYGFIQRQGFKPVVVARLPHFHVTKVNFKFLWHSTRAAALDKRFLLHATRGQGLPAVARN